MTRVHVSAPNEDGSHTGYLVDLEIVPRIGEKVTFPDGFEVHGGDRKFVVEDVRYIVFVNEADSTGGLVQVEVTLANP